MSENTTRIADLPDNGYHNNFTHSQNNNSKMNFDEVNTTYIPMNIHPNPYGNNIQMEVMPHPEYKPQQINQMQQNMNPHIQYIQQMQPTNEVININMDYEQKQMLENIPQMRLPSRDIPMNQSAYQQDEEIQPNYIPKPKLTGDYVREYEEATEKSIKKQEKKRAQNEKIDDIFTDFQLPILIAILFMVFQLPIINNILFNYVKFLPLFGSDGNINFYGIMIKSILFGIVIFIIQKMTGFLLSV